jgi:hypothetical protein
VPITPHGAPAPATEEDTMTADHVTYWIHPMDFVRRRRWTGPVPPRAETVRLGTPRIS